jgi:hypothetical protein
MRIAALAACLFPLAMTTPALAEQQCDTREAMLDTLAEEYGEVPVAVGEHANGDTIELVSKSDGDTWSLVVTSEEGWSCLLAAGESWRELRVQQSRNPAEAE